MFYQDNSVPGYRPLNEGKFFWNMKYIEYCIRQGYLDGMRIKNLIRTSGLCVSDQALLAAYCVEKGYIVDESI